MPILDVFTLSLVALPMWVLYEVSILIVKIKKIRRTDEENMKVKLIIHAYLS